MLEPRGKLSRLDRALQGFEELLDISITIIDRGGVFHSPEGLALLSYWRQSHRKNAICEAGFSQDLCIGHCRHEMNEQGAEEGEPFVHTCWKGVQEVVVPLFRDGTHFGSLFAGIWRRPGTQAPLHEKELPAEAGDAYRNLPEFDDERAERLKEPLRLVAQGILAHLDQAIVLDAAPRGRKAEIRRFLRYNAGEQISLQNLADTLHLSPSRTSHVVRDLFGKGFRTLLRDERINRAKYLLQVTDFSVGAVARQVGMPDEYHFNRTFKACVGMPPGRYRRHRWEPGRAPSRPRSPRRRNS